MANRTRTARFVHATANLDDLDPVLPDGPHTDLLRVTTTVVVGQDFDLRPPAFTRSYGMAWRESWISSGLHQTSGLLRNVEEWHGIVADCKWPVSGRGSNLATSWNTRLARYAD